MKTKHELGKPQLITLAPRAVRLVGKQVKVMVIGGSVNVQCKTPEKAVWVFGKIRGYLEHYKVAATITAVQRAIFKLGI